MKTVLARPGSLYVGKVEDQDADAIVLADPAAGWAVPRGIRHWEREVTVIARDDITDDVRAQLKATFPEEQIAPAKLPLAFHAASSSPFVAVSRKLIPDLVALGIRVHTVGADRASSSFFYFAEGAKEDPVRVQGDLLTVIMPTLTGDETTAVLDQHLESLVDRLLLHLSKGTLSEIAVELAAALPRLNADGTGLEDVDLEAFEREAETMVKHGKGFEKEARDLSERLQAAADAVSIDIPLFGVAKREPQFELTVEIEGEKLKVGRRARWVVRGEPVAKLAAGTSPWTGAPPPVAASEASAKPTAVEAFGKPAATAPAARVAPAPAAKVAAPPPAAAPPPVREEPKSTPKVAAPPPSVPKVAARSPGPPSVRSKVASTPGVPSPKPAPVSATTKAASPRPAPVSATTKAAAPARPIDPPTPLQAMPIVVLEESRKPAEDTPVVKPVVETAAAAKSPLDLGGAEEPTRVVSAPFVPKEAFLPGEAAAPARTATAAPEQEAAAAPAATKEVAVPAAAPSNPDVAATAKAALDKKQPEKDKAKSAPIEKAKPADADKKKATTAANAGGEAQPGAGTVALVFLLLLVMAVAAYIYAQKH